MYVCALPSYFADSYQCSSEIELGLYHKRNVQECDVWSLGVILYMMLTGSPPFNGGNEMHIMQSVRNNDIEYMDEHWGRMPEAKALVKKMLVSACLCSTPVLVPATRARNIHAHNTNTNTRRQ